MRKPLWTVCFVLSILARALGAPQPGKAGVDPKTARFDRLLRKVQTDPGGTSAAEVRELLDLAGKLGRPYQASLSIRGYLSHHFKPSPELLLATAEAAYHAGDYTFAVARLKAYLAAAKPSPQAGRAAANLYALLIDFLGAEDNAYQFMARHGHTFRSQPPARRFDSWFLAQARSRRDYAAAARYLALALADRMPLEQERLYYWAQLDWLTREVSQASPAQYAALPHCRRIVPLIRGDKRRAARLAWVTANLAFHAGAAGKSPDALERDFEPVVQAARDYLGAFPTAETLQEILHGMAGGLGRFDHAVWGRQKGQKRALFVWAFGRLEDADREEMMRWHDAGRARDLATPAQWAQLGQKHTRLFLRSDATRHVPLPVEQPSRDDYKRLAAFCKGVPSEDAAIINALAAGDDLDRAVDHLMKNDAWHLPLGRYRALLRGRLFPAYEKMAKAAKKDLPRETVDKAWLHFGSTYVARSPIAIYDPEAVKEYLRAAWRVGGKDRNDKGRFPGHLASLAWVPFENVRNRRGARGEILRAVSEEARRWAENLRREARKKRKDGTPAVDPAILAQIGPVTEALRKARNEADPAKAPNELCKAMAEAVLAERARRDDPRLRAERRLYELVKNYPTARTAYGRDVFGRIIPSRQRNFGNFDFQLAMLADQLGRFRVGARDEPVERLIGAIFSHRHEWGLRQSHVKYKARSLAVNALLGKAVLRLAGKGQFSARLFNWFRDTRVGRNWTDGNAGQEVMAKIIDQRLFHKSGYRAGGASRSATTSYMRLIRQEFPGLAARYPVESHFDDMFVEEAGKTRFLDWSYWEFGRDEQKKVTNAAAKLLARDPLPTGSDDAEGVYSLRTLMRWLGVALNAEKGTRERLLARCDAAYGKTRFDAYAMGYGYFANGADASKPAGRKAFFQRLGTYVDRAAEAPARLSMPALPQLKVVTAESLTERELAVLIAMFTEAPSPWWTKGYEFDTAGRLIHESLAARRRQSELFGLIGHFWKVARDHRDYNVWKEMTRRVDDLRKGGQRDLALAYSTVGLTLLKDELSGELRTALGSVRTWALAEMGGVIPVPRGHPLRPLYEAQLAYLTGRYQTAWETYLAQRARLAKSFKEFDPQFCIWVIRKNTEFRDFDEAEALAKEMIAWFDEVSNRFEAEVRAHLQLSYADIALARDDRPRARALYERIVAHTDFAGTRARLDAELKIADVDARDGNFDRAIERLEGLSRRKNRYLQTEAAYHMATVKYAQEEYAEAKEHLEQLFALSGDHAEGRILEGKVNLRLKKLEQPTDIDLGEKIGRKYIVPGRPVRVSLVDRNLSIVRQATEIEIRAWTDSGDEEFFSLTPFGDSKVKFKGQLATELGAVKKRDHVIQVIGKDRVHYAFSDRFAKVQKIEDNRPYTLLVATDAELYASSGRILSKEQRQARALEAMIRKRMGADAPAAGKPAPLSTVRAEDQIKPGNRINVRVVDPDRGETRAKDRITVRLATASGDAIAACTLEETGPHSGVFEGSVPTEPAQATATASDSQEGTEANFAISSRKYPAWVGLPKPSRSRPKTFSVDLNDNVSLGRMKLVAAEPTRKLKRFLVQTSFNGRDFTTVGAWPATFAPWTGKPTLELARYVTEEGAERRGQIAGPKTVHDFRDYLERGHIREAQEKLTRPIRTLAADWDYKLDGAGRQIGLDGNRNSRKYYVAHMKAAFHQARRQIRTFTLRHKGDLPAREYALTYLLAVDGEGTSQPRRGSNDREFAIEAKRDLGKGVHTIEVFVFAHQHAKASFEVTCDSDKPPYVIPCPAEMFDAAKHPEIARGLARDVAGVKAGDDDTTFEVAFPAGTRARIVRLLLTDFESDAPAIGKIHLTDAGGKQVLPTRHDFMDLRKNDVLEIVPGDRITVTYEDPKVLTRGKELHEAFLTATYTNATVGACFVEYTLRADGERQARYVPMRRFQAGDKINVFIQDPDGDVSDKLDTVKFTARTSEGQTVQLDALETEEHSGVFLGVVFPIAGRPKRKSELTVRAGDDVVLTYLDRENTDPGIPWERTFAVEQVWFDPPNVRLYEVTSLTLEEADKLAGRKASARPSRPRGRRRGRRGQTTAEIAAMRDEHVPARRTLLAVRPQASDQKTPARIVIGGPLLVEVLFPYITKSAESTCSVYAQTSSGRKKHGKPGAAGTFDPNVPGTIKLTRTVGDVSSFAPPPGYREVVVHGDPYALSALDDGRFTFSVPIKLGAVPEKSLIAAEALADGEQAEPIALAIRGDDRIYIGLSYKDEAGRPHWVTREAALSGDFFLDAMDRRYQEKVEALHVGENLYFRVIDPTRDATDGKDVVQVDLACKGGRPKKLDLVETYSHSGVFKGLVKVVHAEDKPAAAEKGNMPAVYGDVLTARYTQPKTRQGESVAAAVFKGADGKVVPFTKRFKDPGIAVETQFMIAEACFELAKRHRQLGQDSLARREIAQGRKLLEEAIRDYPNMAARAQAEYLLADLSLEFGNDAVHEEIKKKHYLDAITRYSDIVATYPDSEYAPKAQYRKALAYEKMEMLDQACEEYVKLSYRYPDNPLVAETIARLGQYFLNKGRSIRTASEKLTDPVEREKARLKAAEMLKTAGEVFGRLSVRFPSHRLAGKTMLLSAQCFMQAEDYDRAVKGYVKVQKAPDMDKDLVAEATYWCGHSHMETKDLVKAYQMFKKLTWDYPATKWAKFARGRLADEAFQDIED